MTATDINPVPRPAREHPRASRRLHRRGFTLTELLVVIALIVLLVGLLLAAMGKVQAKSRETSTIATMQAFSNACETFQQEHGFYPGVVPEDVLANDPKISGTENAMLHLLGGFARQDDDEEAYDEFSGRQIVFSRPDGTQYRVKVDRDRIGEGPIINGKPFAPYLTPGDRELAIAPGQWVIAAARAENPDSNDFRLPDLLDAWGQPIVYARRLRSIGPLTDPDPVNRPQFMIAPMTPYLDSASPPGPGLGRLGQNQSGGILGPGTDDIRLKNLKYLLQHPALAGQARGAFLLLSAGADGIYLSSADGPGSPSANVTDVGELIEIGELPPTIFDEYDDVVSFGGS